MSKRPKKTDNWRAPLRWCPKHGYIFLVWNGCPRCRTYECECGCGGLVPVNAENIFDYCLEGS